MNRLIYPINKIGHKITCTPIGILWCNIIAVYLYVCIKIIFKIYIRDIYLCTLCMCMYIVHMLNLQIELSILKQIIRIFKKIIWIWKLTFEFWKKLFEFKICYLIWIFLVKSKIWYFNFETCYLNLRIDISILKKIIWISNFLFESENWYYYFLIIWNIYFHIFILNFFNLKIDTWIWIFLIDYKSWYFNFENSHLISRIFIWKWKLILSK